MTSPAVLIQCPVCAVRLKVQAARDSSRVRCPGCRREIQLMPAGKRSREQEAFEDLPAPLLVSEPVLPPRRKFWRSFSRSLTAALADNRQTLTHGLIGCLLLAATVAIGAGLYSSRDQLPLESMEVLLPGHDSPEKILEQYANTTEAMVKQMTSITDVDSRDATIPVLRRLIEGCHLLIARAVAIGPLPREEVQLLDEWFANRLPAQSQLVHEMAKSLHARRQLGSEKLHAVLFDLTTATSRFGPTIETVWATIPEPEFDSQQVAHQITMIHYRVWCASVSVWSEQQFRELDATLASAASELESILVKHFAQGRNQTELGTTPYAALNDRFLDDLQLRVNALQSKLGVPSDYSAFERFRDAGTALGNAQRNHDA